LEYSGYHREPHDWDSIFSCPGLRCDSCGFPVRSKDENSPMSLFSTLVRIQIRQSAIDCNRSFVRRFRLYVQSVPLSRSMALATILDPNGPPHTGNYNVQQTINAFNLFQRQNGSVFPTWPRPRLSICYNLYGRILA